MSAGPGADGSDGSGGPGAPAPGGPAAGERLRVVHVIDSLSAAGGAENRLVDEVLALADRFDQVVVRLFEQDFLDGRLEEGGIRVVPLGFQAATAARTWPLAARRLRALLRDVRPHVVHTSLFTGNLVGQRAAEPLGIPVVSTFNRTGDLELLRGLRPGAASRRGRFMHALGGRVARRGDVHYRAVGRYALETNCASIGLPTTSASVVPRGIEVGDVTPADRAGLGVPPGAPLVVNVARLVPEKAQHLLVEAFATVRAKLNGAHLVIAGSEGANQAAVEAAVAHHGLAGEVRLLGFRADARSLVAAADVFALSSLSEGSPGVVVEAMRLGTPVAAFAIRPVAELTDGGEHAWLAPVGSVEDLADCIVAAVMASDRVQRVRAAREWAERFSLAAVAAQLGDLLETRARRPGAGTAEPDESPGAAPAVAPSAAPAPGGAA